LNRFAFGPRPGEADALMRQGLDAWLETQLSPPPAADPTLETALAPYRDALAPPATLVESWLGADWMLDESNAKNFNQRIQPFVQEHLRKLALAELTRHVVSPRQLEEVMVDFWANHFNVFAKKGLVRVFAGDYLERTLRPRALGRFEDLLLATAKHPAMLIYLDNAQSSREDPEEMSAEPQRRGLNENYARELLELHTLGVDGGYTQTDVTETARIFTGWSVKRPQRGELVFAFKKNRHDAGPKTVLGAEFPSGGGESEGARLLGLLAAHPSTAAHLARKLCAFFVADEPAASCVSAATRAYVESAGSIGSVVRAIANDASFFAPSSQGKKLKTPVELVASALRATRATPNGTTELSRVLERLGEPILQESVPTGYPETEPEWANSSGMLSRMSFATALAFGRVEGVSADLSTLLPNPERPDLVAEANRVLLGGAASERTLAAASRALEGERSADKRRALAVALLLGSPEFQRQ
jgi:uncharacterized protein (DUF1800 family)